MQPNGGEVLSRGSWQEPGDLSRTDPTLQDWGRAAGDLPSGEQPPLWPHTQALERLCASPGQQWVRQRGSADQCSAPPPPRPRPCWAPAPVALGPQPEFL